VTDPCLRPRGIVDQSSHLYADAWKQVNEFRAC
jgi:hypothetical protein